MLVIAIETSSSVGSVAVLLVPSPSGRGEGEGESGSAPVFYETLFTRGLHHGANLMPAIDAIFEAHKLDRADVGLVCVSVGPGSYTGVRIGLASAKALAFALKVPLLGVSAPDAVIRNLEPKGEAAVIIDARRGQFYVTPYDARSGAWVRTAEHRALDPDAAAKELAPGAMLVGEGVKLFLEVTKGSWKSAPEDAGIPRARWIALLGLERFRSGAQDELLTVGPLYLRPTEAEETWKKKQGNL